LIRLETMIEISRGDGAVLRIARDPCRGSGDPAGKT
jgi:propanediol utilization protein